MCFPGVLKGTSWSKVVLEQNMQKDTMPSYKDNLLEESNFWHW